MSIYSLQQSFLTTVHKILFIVSVLCYCTFAHAATLSMTPATGVYKAGQTFSAKVLVNTNGASINAADGTLTFNPKEISVVGISKGPIFNLWTADPAFSNTTGSITFSGGSPTGYTGTNGVVIAITLRANSAGSPKVSFSSGSVLAADGKGTNVLTKMNGGAFTIAAEDSVPKAEVVIEYVPPANTPAAPQIQSTTHPDQNKWYSAKIAELSWAVPAGITAVRTLLDETSTSIPTKVYDSPMSKLSLTDLHEGIQYFHIQFKNKEGWGKPAHYKLAIDSVKPTKFDITLQEGTDAANPIQKLALKVEDATSKVQRYMVQIDGKSPYEYINSTGSSTISLTTLVPGRHTVVIEAFDEAGNSIVSSFSFTILAFNKPKFTVYPNEINEQVIPVIKGVTRPKSKVEISMIQLGLGVSTAQAVVTKETLSNDAGEFVFIPDGKLTLGVYELTAVATDQYGAQSDVSDSVRIAVQQPGYIRIGSLIIGFLSVLIPLLSLLALLVVGIWWALLRFRLLKKGVSKEASEAHKMLSSEFVKIKDVLRLQKNELELSRKTKKLTKSEQDLFASIEVVLRSSEARVLKEIADVESLVD